MILSYARVSTDEQAADGRTSLAEQKRKNKAISDLRGVRPDDFAVYVDSGVSGSIPLSCRPAGGDMLAAARSGDVIVANKLDRLFRSASDALATAKDLQDRGIGLILIDMGTEPVTQAGAAKLFFGMLALVAEFERERIAERIQGGRIAKRQRLGHIGGEPPWGYRKVGKGRDAQLIPDPEEQDVLTLMRNMRRFRNPNKVAVELNELGIRSRAGSAFQRIQVVRMLRQEVRCG